MPQWFPEHGEYLKELLDGTFDTKSDEMNGYHDRERKTLTEEEAKPYTEIREERAKLKQAVMSTQGLATLTMSIVVRFSFSLC